MRIENQPEREKSKTKQKGQSWGCGRGLILDVWYGYRHQH